MGSRFLRGVAVGVGATLVTLSVGAAYAWSLAVSGSCGDLERADLSIDELVAVKRRVDAYRRDPSTALHLSGREASFVLREQWRYPVFVALHGDELELNAQVESASGCYDIGFRGQVTVDAGVAQIVPSALRVGDLDLSRWAAGHGFQLRPTHLSTGHASALLGQMTHLHIADGEVALRVEDPGALK